MERKHKIICPDCKGNGFIRVDYALAKEEIHAKCETCNYEGAISAELRHWSHNSILHYK